MPEKTEKKPRAPKAPPLKLNTLSLTEMRELWPQSDDGKLCARLLQRYGFTVLVENTVNATGSPMTASTEVGMSKMAASLVRDFGTLGDEVPTAPKRPPLQTLNRFKTEKPETEKP